MTYTTETVTDSLHERDLADEGIRATVLSVLGEPSRLIVELDSADLDALIHSHRNRYMGGC